MIDVGYADDLALLVNTPATVESLLHSLERAARRIGVYLNVKQEEAIFILSGMHLKFVNQFKYLSSNVSSIESYVNIYIGKAWTAIDRNLISLMK